MKSISALLLLPTIFAAGGDDHIGIQDQNEQQAVLHLLFPIS